MKVEAECEGFENSASGHEILPGESDASSFLGFLQIQSRIKHYI
jgi:hypothetical protein